MVSDPCDMLYEDPKEMTVKAWSDYVAMLASDLTHNPQCQRLAILLKGSREILADLKQREQKRAKAA
ncbi:hypothetical protein D5085_04700 [Ectothiorhodospiraceae bacterium BW-2]|nr:hypothetical protein D5085_04700 [Ectothiorhodospiraceae bacterium BW-2]